MAPIRLGIIGCGIAARELHWPALKQLTRKFRITCVCNHTEPKAKEFARIVGGVPYVLDYNELLQREDVDAVNIILPVELNHEVTRAALKAGKHVIVEKPIAANLREANAMVKLAEKSPQVAMVAENMCYEPTVHKLKGIIDKGTIGRVYAAHWLIYVDVAPETSHYARTDWRLNHQYPGGFLMDAGVHQANALHQLFGELEVLPSRVKSVNPVIGKTDTLEMRFRSRDGIDGLLVLFFSAKGIASNRLMVMGDKGSAILEGSTITIKKRGAKDKIIQTNSTGGYREEFEDFHRAITQGTEPLMTFAKARQDFQFILNGLKRGH